VQTLNPAMSETQNDPEDLLIRNILVTAAVGAAAALLGLALAVTAMISANWNFMDWME
jgi:hypothetical protein